MSQVNIPLDNLIQDDNYRIYNAKDAWVTQLIAKRLNTELKEDNLFYHYSEIVQPLARVLNKVNLRGLWVDEAKRLEAIETINSEVCHLEQNISSIAGRQLNVRSRDFATFLFDELHVPCRKRNKDGSGSITQALLEELSVGKIGKGISQAKEVAKLALDIRRKKKLVSTFLESAIINPETGRVHSNYKIGPVTGRLASSKPAFLTIPKGIARDIYAAPPGKVFCYADCSQLELRILAILANDLPLLEAFAAGRDVHMENARDLLGEVEWAKLDAQQQDRVRFFAKMFIYAMNYGGSIETVMESGAEIFKNVSSATMKAMERRYFAAHPAITAFRRSLKRALYRDHKLVNVFGRPRIFFSDPTKALRSAYNFPMQSGGADHMNKCMIELDKRVPDSIVLQVHDALVLEVDEDKGERTLAIMKEVLEAPVPELNNHIIPVNAKLGKRWGEF